MEYGPCGGVSANGSCELGDFPCAFVGAPVREFTGIDGAWIPQPAPPTAAGVETAALLDAGQVVVADFSAAPLSLDSLESCAAVLKGEVDIVLAGDANEARVQFPPSLRVHLMKAQGLRVWAGFNARDRNRVALEAELHGLRAVGVDGVHCVTGDHTASGHRADAMPVFDLDATEMTSLAASLGHLVSVAAQPGRMPAESRLPLVLQKERAGAQVCFIDHCGGVEVAADFVRQARAAGSQLRFIACVPVVIDSTSAEALAQFPGIALPAGYVEGIAGASDVRAAGIAAAVELSLRMLEVDGILGVDLSGGAGPGQELAFAEALAQISSRIKA